jgi:hypothetical protein
MQREVVAVGIKLLFVIGLNPDVPTKLSFDFTATKNHACTAE